MAERTSSPREPWIFRGYSAESLGALRIALAAGYLVYQLTQFYPVLELRPGRSWALLEPMWFMDVLGLEWLHPGLAWAAFALSLVATAGVLVGRHTRLSILTVLITMTYLKGLRDSVVGDTHHRLTIWWMLFLFLLLSECGRALSLDAARHPRRTELPAWRASWPIHAMQIYLVSFYFWSGVAKLRVSGYAWLEGGGKLREVLLRRSAMWGLDDAGQPLGNPLAFELAHHPTLLEAMGLFVLAMELGLPLLLCVRSTRARLLILGIVTLFHIGNFILLYVGFVLMPLAFVVFFDLAPLAARWRARRAVVGAAFEGRW